VPALHGARLLLNDLQQIKDAPKEVLGIREDVASIESALVSFQAVDKDEWKLLGGNLNEQTAALIEVIKIACIGFKTNLDQWTRHSSDGKLAWRDRASIGFFNQRWIKSISG
jgi:hypothetical protein